VSALSAAIEELRSNPRQWEAFASRGDVVVLAPPGSGKTKLLTVRMVHDLRESIPEPHGAACITYTNAAAGELQRRATELGIPRRSNIVIGTVHAFAMGAILRPYARLAGRPEALAPIATKEQRDACYMRAEDAVYGPYENRTGVKNTVQLRRQHLNYDASDVIAGGERSAQVAERWEAILAEEGLVDFDAVVRHAVAIVQEHAWVRRALAARFPRLFLDEYQDLAPGLDELARALCFDESADADLFAVGDPDQSIMGFNGSRPELLHALAKDDRVTCVRLETNYRSRGKIVQTALMALGEDRTIEWLTEGGAITLHECVGGPDDQRARMVEIVEEQRVGGTPLGEIAVLCPNRWIKADAAAALASAHVRFFARGDEYRETPTTALIEGLAAWATQRRGESGFRLGDLLSRWRTLVPSRETLRADTALIDLLYANGDGTQSASEFVSSVANTGLYAQLRRSGRQDELDELELMVEAVTTGDLSELDVAGLGRRAHAPDQVQVSTIHAGKGLEFEVVIVIALDEGDFPSWMAQTEREIADARRAFYVSLTRAKRRLDLLYSGFRITQKGLRRDDGRCRFIDDIADGNA
jgi:DNA helicase-2/ATP-dependent DNA helicase PcrA